MLMYTIIVGIHHYMRAALRGHLGVVRVLISEFKADVNVINK